MYLKWITGIFLIPLTAKLQWPYIQEPIYRAFLFYTLAGFRAYTKALGVSIYLSQYPLLGRATWRMHKPEFENNAIK